MWRYEEISSSESYGLEARANAIYHSIRNKMKQLGLLGGAAFKGPRYCPRCKDSRTQPGPKNVRSRITVDTAIGFIDKFNLRFIGAR
jgi:hypothetical protein